MPRLDADTQLGIDTIIGLGIINSVGLRRFAGLVKSLQGIAAWAAPAAEISRTLVNDQPVAVIAKRGRKRRRRKLKVTKEDLRQAYATKSSSELAKEYGVSTSAVQQRLQRWHIKKPSAPAAVGVEPKAAKVGKPARSPWLALSKDDLRRVYAQKRAREIAKEYGLSISGVSNRMTRLGIKKSAGKGAAKTKA